MSSLKEAARALLDALEHPGATIELVAAENALRLSLSQPTEPQESIKYTRDFGDYATEGVMAWIDDELARCDAPMGSGLPYIPADKDVGDALRWLRANLFGIRATAPGDAGEPVALIVDALKNSKPAQDHYPEPVKRHADALAAAYRLGAERGALERLRDLIHEGNAPHWPGLPQIDLASRWYVILCDAIMGEYERAATPLQGADALDARRLDWLDKHQDALQWAVGYQGPSSFAYRDDSGIWHLGFATARAALDAAMESSDEQ